MTGLPNRILILLSCITLTITHNANNRLVNETLKWHPGISLQLMAMFFAALLLVVLCLVPALYMTLWRVRRHKQGVCVVVLGDLGRSPRMQYHSLSLADAGFTVDVVGYGGESVFTNLYLSVCVYECLFVCMFTCLSVCMCLYTLIC